MMLHRHRWINKKVEHYTFIPYDQLARIRPLKATPKQDTRVLQVCDKCGKPRTYELSGEWELEDL